MGHIGIFSFSNPDIQNNPGKITAFLNHTSKGEISKNTPGRGKKINC